MPAWNKTNSQKSTLSSPGGLEPVVAFCYPESSLRSENAHPFIARIDSFGTPAVKPFVFDRQIYTIPEFTRTDLESEILNAATRIAELKSPRVRVDMAEHTKRVVVKYYSSRRRPLTLESFGSFEDSRTCAARKSQNQALLEEFGTAGVWAFCTGEQFSDVAPLYYFGLVTGAYRIERAAGSHQTRAACEAQLPQVIAQYQSARGAANADGFCSYERADVFAPYAFYSRVIFSI
jgi:hypothetical protein